MKQLWAEESEHLPRTQTKHMNINLNSFQKMFNLTEVILILNHIWHNEVAFLTSALDRAEKSTLWLGFLYQ